MNGSGCQFSSFGYVVNAHAQTIEVKCSQLCIYFRLYLFYLLCIRLIAIHCTQQQLGLD